MEPAGYLEAIRREGAAAAAAARLGLEPAVWTCPGWTVADVIGHLGVVHRHKEKIVRLGLRQNPPPEDPPAIGLIDWFDEGLAMLTATLEAVDPSTHIFSWYEPDQTAGFWYRRMAHETLIHRVDAEIGHGRPGPVDPALALDGVEEVLSVFMAGVPAWAEGTAGLERVRLVAAGGDHPWTLRFGTWSGTSPGSGIVYTDEPSIEFDDQPGDADAEVAGPAELLDLWLWGRGSLDGLAVSGDGTLVQRLRDIAAMATG